MSQLPRVRHVGLNAIFLQPQMGGLETYVRELVPALLDVRPDLRVSIFVNELGKRVLVEEPWSGQVELVTHPLLGRPYTRALTEISFLGLLASRRGLDVLHNIAMLGPLRSRPAQVLTVADVTWLRYPDPAEWITRMMWRTLVPLSARRADRVLVFSEAARAQVAPDLHVPEDRIDVV
ncbi:MAG: glycosyltransferase, partial [Dehalococcoidia bacterium]